MRTAAPPLGLPHPGGLPSDALFWRVLCGCSCSWSFLSREEGGRARPSGSELQEHRDPLRGDSAGLRVTQWVGRSWRGHRTRRGGLTLGSARPSAGPHANPVHGSCPRLHVGMVPIPLPILRGQAQGRDKPHGTPSLGPAGREFRLLGSSLAAGPLWPPLKDRDKTQHQPAIVLGPGGVTSTMAGRERASMRRLSFREQMNGLTLLSGPGRLPQRQGRFNLHCPEEGRDIPKGTRQGHPPLAAAGPPPALPASRSLSAQVPSWLLPRGSTTPGRLLSWSLGPPPSPLRQPSRFSSLLRQPSCPVSLQVSSPF